MVDKDKKEFIATLETRTSKKGNQYDVLIIHLTDKLEKPVFLEQSEIELLRLISEKEKNNKKMPF